LSTITGQWRDAGEAFRPKVDFGDTPATYDPASADPAVHEITPLLSLGSNSNNEWSFRGQTALANSDSFDDEMQIGSLVNPSAGTFFTQIDYLNNTDAPATICAWVDFNNNGLFDTNEGQIQTNLPSSASTQTVYFNWTGVSTPLTNGQNTYVRFRVTSMANGMSTAIATGFFDNGEVEDYRVIVAAFTLETNLVTFTAVKTETDKVSLSWEVAEEKAGTIYTAQRSADGRIWKNINVQQSRNRNSSDIYHFIDPETLLGAVYYRLKVTESNGFIYSDTRKLVNTETWWYPFPRILYLPLLSFHCRPPKPETGK